MNPYLPGLEPIALAQEAIPTNQLSTKHRHTTEPFLVRPGLQQDELLSSWLARVAAHNGFLSGMPRPLLPTPEHTVSGSDIDLWADNGCFDNLAIRTFLASDRIREASLVKFEGAIFEKVYDPWFGFEIIPLTLAGLRYCPECLAEDERPYFRQHWRIAYFPLCERHNAWLHSKCPNCANNVEFYSGREANARNNKQAIFDDSAYVGQILAHCYHCGFDLRQATQKVKDAPSVAEVKFQQHLLDALRDGATAYPTNSLVKSDELFAGIRALGHLVILLVSGRKCGPSRFSFKQDQQHKRETIRVPGLDNIACSFSWQAEMYFPLSEMDFGQQRMVLNIIQNLLADWPRNFAEFYEGNRILPSEIKMYEGHFPDWYWQTIKRLT